MQQPVFLADMQEGSETMLVLSLGVVVVDITDVVVMATELQLETTAAADTVHVDDAIEDVAVTGVAYWFPGCDDKLKVIGGDEDKDIDDDDDESAEVLPEDELSDVDFGKCVRTSEKTESELPGGVKIYGGDEKLELSEEDLSSELPVDEECSKGFERHEFLWFCEVCQSR
jgi:hypothetical protein